MSDIFFTNNQLDRNWEAFAFDRHQEQPQDPTEVTVEKDNAVEIYDWEKDQDLN